jgi:hypothetical protein
MKTSSFALVAIAALLFVVPAAAHHSHAMYDASGEIELDGVLTEVRWANPHVWLYLDVENEDGTSRSWAMEGAAIDQLARKGWEREMLRVGSPIKISCYQLRSGGPGCLGGYVLSIDGEELPPTHDLHAGREFD